MSFKVVAPEVSVTSTGRRVSPVISMTTTIGVSSMTAPAFSCPPGTRVNKRRLLISCWRTSWNCLSDSRISLLSTTQARRRPSSSTVNFSGAWLFSTGLPFVTSPLRTVMLPEPEVLALRKSKPGLMP